MAATVETPKADAPTASLSVTLGEAPAIIKNAMAADKEGSRTGTEKALKEIEAEALKPVTLKVKSKEKTDTRISESKESSNPTSVETKNETNTETPKAEPVKSEEQSKLIPDFERNKGLLAEAGVFIKGTKPAIDGEPKVVLEELSKEVPQKTPHVEDESPSDEMDAV